MILIRRGHRRLPGRDCLINGGSVVGLTRRMLPAALPHLFQRADNEDSVKLVECGPGEEPPSCGWRTLWKRAQSSITAKAVSRPPGDHLSAQSRKQIPLLLSAQVERRELCHQSATSRGSSPLEANARSA